MKAVLPLSVFYLCKLLCTCGVLVVIVVGQSLVNMYLRTQHNFHFNTTKIKRLVLFSLIKYVECLNSYTPLNGINCVVLCCVVLCCVVLCCDQ